MMFSNIYSKVHLDVRTGADLCNDIVSIVNPEAYLATINEDAELKFTLVIEKGIGYVPSEEIRENVESGYIALDAFFTPVKHAVYEIENVLVEDNPDYTSPADCRLPHPIL